MVKATKKEKKVGTSASAIAVAEALLKTFPKEAERIVGVMSVAATSASMKRKLARVQKALAGLQKVGA